MFMQVIQGHVRDAEALRRAAEQWRNELQAGARGFLGSTSGVTQDGTGVVVARFETEEAARANSQRPEQSAWWERTAPIFDEGVSFIDCPDCDVVMGGGSDDAHFVQLIECRATDREAMRQVGRALEESLPTQRPEILGGVLGWRDDHEFVQVMYFTDEEHARTGERAMQDNPQAQQWVRVLDGEPKFLDLREPTFAPARRGGG
jgi:hypothetical protein